MVEKRGHGKSLVFYLFDGIYTYPSKVAIVSIRQLPTVFVNPHLYLSLTA